MKKPPDLVLQQPRHPRGHRPRPCALCPQRQAQADSAQGHRQVSGQTHVVCAPRTHGLEEGEADYCVVTSSTVDGSQSMTARGEGGDGDRAEGGCERSCRCKRPVICSPTAVTTRDARCSSRLCGPWKAVPCVTRPPQGRLPFGFSRWEPLWGSQRCKERGGHGPPTPGPPLLSALLLGTALLGHPTLGLAPPVLWLRLSAPSWFPPLAPQAWRANSFSG